MMKLKRDYRNRSDRVQSMMKTRHNNMIAWSGTVYDKNYTEQLGPIEPNAIYDENLTRQ